MSDEKRRRVNKNPSEEIVELRSFAKRIIRGDENRPRQWLRGEERWRRIEAGADWLKGRSGGGG